jgi:hypothetical protein
MLPAALLVKLARLEESKAAAVGTENSIRGRRVE